MFNPGPHPYGLPPIALGGLGPQMVSLAAEVADGLLVMPFNTASPPAHADPAGGGRGTGPRRAVPVGPDGDRRGHRVLRTGRGRARDGPHWRAAGSLSFYASTPAYRPVLEVEGWEDLQPELNALSKAGRWDEMPGRIDDTMLATLAAVGSPRRGGRRDRATGSAAWSTGSASTPPTWWPTRPLGELVDELPRTAPDRRHRRPDPSRPRRAEPTEEPT